MGNSDNKSVKIAIQKDGRLTQDTVSLLRAAGLSFENYNRKLFVKCRNYPAEVLYVRDDDIPYYVASGIADLGIVGQNVLRESGFRVNTLLDLGFCRCSLVIAVPQNSNISRASDLRNSTIATSYPNSAKEYFKENKIPIKIVNIKGAVEIAPSLGFAHAIVDIVATGKTLVLNNLRILQKISDSQALLITPNEVTSKEKAKIIDDLKVKISEVLGGKDYEYL
ncbi:MAG: ATP phosphoribosyltransferase [Candidatus Blackburnbacteria bacterium]|nr:ATP phosphoribosyltransferase [Candidatus Blackburnbacteria bacterium]